MQLVDSLTMQHSDMTGDLHKTLSETQENVASQTKLAAGGMYYVIA